MTDEVDRKFLRRRALNALRIHFAQRRWPRVMMCVMMVATGAVGFGASWVMLHAGVSAMWVRYPVAALLAWGALLVFLRLWAEFERRHFVPDASLAGTVEEQEEVKKRSALEDVDSSVLELFNPLELVDVDAEGCLAGVLVLVVALLLFAIAWGVITIVSAAPILIAEVFLDAVLVSILYRRVRKMEERWWLAGAVRHTVVPVAWTVLSLAVAGFLMQSYAPEAKSVGGVWRHYERSKSPVDGTPLLENEEVK